MDKEEARKIFDRETHLLVRTTLEGDHGSVHDLIDYLVASIEPEELLDLLTIIVHADFSREELNLPADNPLPISTDVEGLRHFCSYLYRFGALRYLRMSPGEPMGAGMRGDRGPTIQGPLR